MNYILSNKEIPPHSLEKYEGIFLFYKLNSLVLLPLASNKFQALLSQKLTTGDELRALANGYFWPHKDYLAIAFRVIIRHNNKT